jgi:hypothetical protein
MQLERDRDLVLLVFQSVEKDGPRRGRNRADRVSARLELERYHCHCPRGIDRVLPYAGGQVEVEPAAVDTGFELGDYVALELRQIHDDDAAGAQGAVTPSVRGS